jgi:hypothetical protein
MKIAFTCFRCIDDAKKGMDVQYLNAAEVAIQDSPVYRFQCQRGHHQQVLTTTPKFEVLFLAGVGAMRAGYHREAVADFIASVERFHEFLLYVITVDRKGSREGSGELFKGTWDLIKKQSERQLGAFAFAFQLQVGEALVYLPNAKIAFRNDVIHAGQIPSRAEALSFGAACLEYMRRVSDKLVPTIKGWPNPLRLHNFDAVQLAQIDGVDNVQLANWPPQLVNILNRHLGRQSLEEMVGDEARWRGDAAVIA